MRIKIMCTAHNEGLSGEPFFTAGTETGEWVVNLSAMWCVKPEHSDAGGCYESWTVSS